MRIPKKILFKNRKKKFAVKTSKTRTQKKKRNDHRGRKGLVIHRTFGGMLRNTSLGRYYLLRRYRSVRIHDDGTRR